MENRTFASKAEQRRFEAQTKPRFIGLVQGRIVRYVTTMGDVLPAVVVDVKDTSTGTVALGVFGSVYTYQEPVVYDEDKMTGTWHWPPLK